MCKGYVIAKHISICNSIPYKNIAIWAICLIFLIHKIEKMLRIFTALDRNLNSYFLKKDIYSKQKLGRVTKYLAYEIIPDEIYVC